MKNTAKSILTIALMIVLLPVVAYTFCPCAQASPSNQMVLKAAPCHHGCCPDMMLSLGQNCAAEIQKSSDLIRPGEILEGLRLVPSDMSGAIVSSGQSADFKVDSSPHRFSQDSPLYLLLSVFRI